MSNFNISSKCNIVHITVTQFAYSFDNYRIYIFVKYVDYLFRVESYYNSDVCRAYVI